MTSVAFGDHLLFAKVLFDRSLALCVLYCNSEKHLSDALALIRSIGADEVVVIAPKEIHHLFEELKPSQELSVYEL